jgi:uncharacterized protein (DUF736 family)
MENEARTNDRGIGALWIKEAKNGRKYMSGVVEHGGEKINIVVFKNDRKTQPNQPDYKILPAGERQR